jgi:hypothetical protein
MSRKKKIVDIAERPPDAPTGTPDRPGNAPARQSADDFSPAEKKRIMAQGRHVTRERAARKLAEDFLALRIHGKKGVRTVEELLDRADPLCLAERILDPKTDKKTWEELNRRYLLENFLGQIRELLFLALTLTDRRASREPKPGSETQLDLDLMRYREQAKLYREAIEAGKAFEAALEKIPWTQHVEILKQREPDSSKKSMDELGRADLQFYETFIASLRGGTERLASECKMQPPKKIKSILDKELADAFSKAHAAADPGRELLLLVVPECLKRVRESLAMLQRAERLLKCGLDRAEKNASAAQTKSAGRPPECSTLFVILARWIVENLAAKIAPGNEAAKKKMRAEVDKFCAGRSWEIFGRQFDSRQIQRRVDDYPFYTHRAAKSLPAFPILRGVADALAERMEWDTCSSLHINF